MITVFHLPGRNLQNFAEYSVSVFIAFRHFAVEKYLTSKIHPNKVATLVSYAFLFYEGLVKVAKVGQVHGVFRKAKCCINVIFSDFQKLTAVFSFSETILCWFKTVEFKAL